MPIMFFILAAALASMGPGNIATAALVAPMAMATAASAGIPLFLMAIMVGNGANAGSLSPFAPTGIIVNGLMARIELGGLEAQTYLYNLGAHAFVAFGGYFLFGGLKLFSDVEARPSRRPASGIGNRRGLRAAALATLGAHRPPDPQRDLLRGERRDGRIRGRRAARADRVRRRSRGHQADAVERHHHGLRRDRADRACSRRPRASTCSCRSWPGSRRRTPSPPLVAFLTGIISVYSSTSGVVLPAFLPMVPGLAAELGGANPFGIAASMNVGGHLVDVSPLSTIGALCIAAAPTDDSRNLFNKLLAWGLSMAVVGAGVCYLLFG